MMETRKRALAATLLTVGLASLLAGVALQAQDGEKKPEKNPRVRLDVLLTSATTGDPIRNASVYIKFKKKRKLRRDEKRQYVGKTDSEGFATFPGIPPGQALIQIVAAGWGTYGKFHKLEGGNMTLEIALDRPPKWF